MTTHRPSVSEEQYFAREEAERRRVTALETQQQMGQAPALHRMVEDLARTAGIPKPRVFVIPEAQPSAFATGRSLLSLFSGHPETEERIRRLRGLTIAFERVPARRATWTTDGQRTARSSGQRPRLGEQFCRLAHWRDRE